MWPRLVRVLLLIGFAAICLAAGNSGSRTTKSHPNKTAKPALQGKPVAFALRQTAKEPEVPAVRFLLAGCGSQFNTLSSKQRTIFDKTLHNAVVKFQTSRGIKPADGVFGPGTMEKAILCQPIRAGSNSASRKMWSVHALQVLLNKNGKRFPAPSEGIFDEKTQEAVKKFNKIYLGRNDVEINSGTWRALFSADPSKPLPNIRPKPINPKPVKPSPRNPSKKPEKQPIVTKPGDQSPVTADKCSCVGAPVTAPTWTAEAQTGTISLRRWSGNTEVLVNLAVCAPLTSLCRAAVEAKLPFPIVSGYRSFDRQRQLHQRACGQDSDCDKEERPGSSVFHGGASIEFDLQGEACGSPLFRWLATNAPRFGFLRSNLKRQSEWTWFSQPPSNAPFSPFASCDQKPSSSSNGEAAPVIDTTTLPADDRLFPEGEQFDPNTEIIG